MTPAEATEHAKLYMELLNARHLLRRIKDASVDHRQEVRLTDYYVAKIEKLTDREE